MERMCAAECGNPVVSKNSRARYCSSTCRSRKSEGRVVALPTPGSPSPEGPVYAATLAELREAERSETAMGQAVLALAARIDQGVDTGSSLSSAVKTLGETLALALKGARRAETQLDKVRQRRDDKRGA